MVRDGRGGGGVTCLGSMFLWLVGGAELPIPRSLSSRLPSCASNIGRSDGQYDRVPTYVVLAACDVPCVLYVRQCCLLRDGRVSVLPLELSREPGSAERSCSQIVFSVSKEDHTRAPLPSPCVMYVRIVGWQHNL